MCGTHCNCGCRNPRESRGARAFDEDEFDEHDQLDALEDAGASDDLDEAADWAAFDALDDRLDVDGDQFTFGTDDRFQVRAQARPPSTRLFPFNSVCRIRPDGADASLAFSGVLIAPRVVLTVKHGLFNNIAAPACGPRASLRTTASKGAVVVCPGLDQSQPAGRRTIARPVRITAPASAQFHHPRVDIGLIILPRPFRVPNRFMLLQPRSDAQTVDRVVTLAGYPNDKPAGTMWAHSDRVQSTNATHLMYQIDLCVGQSGGPVWLLGSGGTRILLAIQSQEVSSGSRAGSNCGRRIAGAPLRNCGVRITCDVIQWILSTCRGRVRQLPAVDGPTFRRCPAPRRAA